MKEWIKGKIWNLVQKLEKNTAVENSDPKKRISEEQKLETWKYIAKTLSPYTQEIKKLSLGIMGIGALSGIAYSSLSSLAIEFLTAGNPLWIPISVYAAATVSHYGANQLRTYHLKVTELDLIIKVNHALNTEIDANPLYQTRRFHKENTSESLIQKMKNSVGNVTGGLYDFMYTVAPSLGIFLGSSVAIMSMSPIIGSLTLATTGGLIYNSVNRYKKNRFLYQDVEESQNKVYEKRGDRFKNISLVKIFGREKHELEKDQKNLQNVKSRSIEATNQSTKETHISNNIMGAFITAVPILAISIFGKENLSELLATTAMAMNMGWRAQDFSAGLTRIFRGKAKLDANLPPLMKQAELDLNRTEELQTESNAKIEFKNVSFQYPETNLTLYDSLNFTVKAGSKIAIKGESGQGKTTLLKLISGIEIPDGGEILINGTDVTRLTEQSLQQNISVISQDIPMFDTSIGENIKYGKLDATPEQMSLALEIAHLNEVISEKEKGLETSIKEFSGGQQQRASIARSVLGQTPIILADEPTSGLDPETAYKVMSLLNTIPATVIVVTHSDEIADIMKDGSFNLNQEGHIEPYTSEKTQQLQQAQKMIAMLGYFKQQDCFGCFKEFTKKVPETKKPVLIDDIVEPKRQILTTGNER